MIRVQPSRRSETSRHPALVTGASGFIGQRLIRALLAQGREVRALYRPGSAGYGMPDSRIRKAEAILERPETYHACLTPPVTVFHLASARPKVGISPERLYRDNVEVCATVAETATRAKVSKFLHVSSAVMYGPSLGQRVTEAGGWREDAVHPYIRSRIQAQKRLTMLVNDGLPLITLCPSIVFGPDTPDHPNRVTRHLSRVQQFGLDVAVESGYQERTLVYVDDVVEALLRAEDEAYPGDELIIGGEDISQRALMQQASRLKGRRSPVTVAIPLPVARTVARSLDRMRGFHPLTGYEAAVHTLSQEWCYSSDRARQRLNWTPTPIQQALARTLQGLSREGAHRTWQR